MGFSGCFNSRLAEWQSLIYADYNLFRVLMQCCLFPIGNSGSSSSSMGSSGYCAHQSELQCMQFSNSPAACQSQPSCMPQSSCNQIDCASSNNPADCTSYSNAIVQCQALIGTAAANPSSLKSKPMQVWYQMANIKVSQYLWRPLLKRLPAFFFLMCTIILFLRVLIPIISTGGRCCCPVLNA